MNKKVHRMSSIKRHGIARMLCFVMLLMMSGCTKSHDVIKMEQPNQVTTESIPTLEVSTKEPNEVIKDPQLEASGTKQSNATVTDPQAEASGTSQPNALVTDPQAEALGAGQPSIPAADEQVKASGKKQPDTVPKDITSSDTASSDSEKTLTLAMVGDVLLHDKINQSGKMKDGTYQYDHLFAKIKEEIASYDLAIVNQEVILGGRELGLSGYPCFNGAYEVGDALSAAGFDVVLHATNHAMDKGEKGVDRCLNYWKKQHPTMGVVGINDSKESKNTIYIYEKNEIKVAILNYTYGTNGIALPKDKPYLVNLLDKKQITTDVKKAKKEADFVIVAPHWGTEYQLSASKDQKYWANIFLDCGVDLVIGTHPHVVEPIEWMKRKDGHQMLVYYSIGNYINATSGTGKGVANRMLGVMANVTLTKDAKGKVSITSYGAEPLVSHVATSKPGKMTTYRLKDYTAALAKKNEICSQDSEFSYQYLVDLYQKVFPEFDLKKGVTQIVKVQKKDSE